MGLIPYKNEPGLDWSDEANIEAMRAALEEVGASLDKSYPLVIGGERIETDGEIVSVNPANPSQVVGRVSAATGREADMALETAIMKRRNFEMLAGEVHEGGKPGAEADPQFAEAIDFLEYCAREMLRLKDGV